MPSVPSVVTPALNVGSSVSGGISLESVPGSSSEGVTSSTERKRALEAATRSLNLNIDLTKPSQPPPLVPSADPQPSTSQAKEDLPALVVLSDIQPRSPECSPPKRKERESRPQAKSPAKSRRDSSGSQGSTVMRSCTQCLKANCISRSDTHDKCLECLGVDHDMPNCPMCKKLQERTKGERARYLLFWRFGYSKGPLTRRQFQARAQYLKWSPCNQEFNVREYLAGRHPFVEVLSISSRASSRGEVTVSNPTRREIEADLDSETPSEIGDEELDGEFLEEARPEREAEGPHDVNTCVCRYYARQSFTFLFQGLRSETRVFSST